MNIENNHLALAFLSIVVIASGCSHSSPPTESSSTSSVQIQNFSAFPQNPYGDQQVRLQMEMKNLGDKNAKDIAAEIYNVPMTSGEQSSESEFILTGSEGSRWRYESEAKAADPENDLPARTKRLRWTMKAPKLDPDLNNDYNFRSKLFYKYNTTATSTITLMDQETYREEGPEGKPNVQNTAGPVKIEINTRNPIVYEQEKSEMCVRVRNEGQGTTFNYENAFQGSGADSFYNLTSNGEDQTGAVKLKVEDQAGVSFEKLDRDTDWVNLIGNEKITCYEIDASGVGSGQSRLEVPFRVDASYGYKKDQSTSVTVTGSDTLQ